MKNAFLGLDVGSISINFVLVDEQKKVVYTSYLRGSGDPVKTIQEGLAAIRNHRIGAEYRIAGVCTTGSGRALAGALIGADLVKNEISAHARAALRLYPDTQTIIEIGGQDSKVTIIRNGHVVDFAMNLVCAAGTGSFLDSQARRLGLSIEEFGELAMQSESPVAIAGRCTVFAESDMIHKQQIGYSQKDIVMGLCMALARNFTGNVCRGKELLPPFLFQGGVSSNPGIRRAFEVLLGHPVIVPGYNMVMGALGSALYAAEASIQESRFRGFAVSDCDIKSAGFFCSGCSNNCEIVEIKQEEKVLAYNGGRCEKWR
ncbi:MAG: acyl-CoA dehydratase activase [Spirochaetaceae bacterium]|jgi:predicted CoA-substrate-specific enzyme activase|nr:acyl-CoA dehydratase activase [Spirochaetaceae bacterium]